jgi:ASC-1-like (ASCH) protein
MKKICLFTLITLMIASVSLFAQSKSYVTLKDKFVGEEDVHHFAVSGFFARSILWLADEHEFYSAIKDVKNVRLIVIPKEAFKAQDVTLNGFKKILKKDGFEELVPVKDSGDDVTLYHQVSPNKKDRYFVIIEENKEIVAMEIRGYIDPEFILANQPVAYSK